jgi:hypothetical protein
MWEGYSLLHFMGDAKAHGQDLGASFSLSKLITNLANKLLLGEVPHN